jgi:hypothetical protein
MTVVRRSAWDECGTSHRRRRLGGWPRTCGWLVNDRPSSSLRVVGSSVGALRRDVGGSRAAAGTLHVPLGGQLVGVPRSARGSVSGPWRTGWRATSLQRSLTFGAYSTRVGITAGDADSGRGGGRMKRAIVAAIIAAGITIGTVGPAFADAPPPTNGGNGAGHSGQCTGNPADRPASCH